MPLLFSDDSVHDFLLYHSVPTLKVDLSRAANSAHSTASRYFSKDDMPTIPNEWSEFNYWGLCKEFSEELQATMPPGAHPVSMSPPPAIRVELAVVDAYVRVTFPQVRRTTKALNFDVRTDRSSLRDHPTDNVCESKADRQMVDVDRNMRLVGEAKLSWNYNSNWCQGQDPAERDTARQVLSQIVFYMSEWDLRYGFITTDQEFVAVRRVGSNYGDIEISKGIPWTSSGGRGMTVSFAIFMLYLKASHDRIYKYVHDNDDGNDNDDDGGDEDNDMNVGGDEDIDMNNGGDGNNGDADYEDGGDKA